MPQPNYNKQPGSNYGKQTGPNWRTILIYFLVIVMFFLLIRVMWPPTNPVTQISFTNFLSMVNQNPTPISSIVVNSTGNTTVTMKNGTIYDLYAPWLLTGNTLVETMSSKGISVIAKQASDSSVWINAIFYFVLPLVILIFFWWWMMRRMGNANSQAFSFTKSPAKVYKPTDKRVTFKDVAGVEEAKDELVSVVDFLKDPQSFSVLGARMPKGVLLVGPPGTGKTLIARAVAGEANVPFFHMSGSDFVELFVGVGASRVRELFTQAKQNSPSIIFIDEIDAVGRQRGAGLGGGHDEREQTLNQLLVEMDGFDNQTAVIVMAATNRPDILDSALLRPGRFDKKILLDPPDIKAREDIIKVHMRGKPIDPKVDVEILARRTPGFVGADLENMINEAALLAAQRKKTQITMSELEEGIDRAIAGPERKSRVVSAEERRIVAYHEIGHAVVGAVLPNADPVHKISIVPRGMHALGFTLQVPTKDKYLMSKDEMLDRLAGMLGGRAAEELVFHQITTGASNDLEVATKLAKDMVCKYGMSDAIGPVAWGEDGSEVFLGRQLGRMPTYSEETASKIDYEIKRLVEESYKKAIDILKNYREKIDDIATILLTKETIEGEELDKLLKGELNLNHNGNASEEKNVARENS